MGDQKQFSVFDNQPGICPCRQFDSPAEANYFPSSGHFTRMVLPCKSHSVSAHRNTDIFHYAESDCGVLRTISIFPEVHR